MKNIFYILLLLPTIIFAQYPSNSGQKITLGEQTTADGLVFRGVASIDTVTATSKITRANKLDTSAYLLLDTVTNLLWHYKIGSNAWTQAGGGVSVSSFSAGTTGLTPSTATTGAVTLGGTLAVANGGTGSATKNFVDLTTTQSSIAGKKTFTTGIATTANIDGDPQALTLSNTSSGTSAESTLYVRNESNNNASIFFQTVGTDFTSIGGFLNDQGTIGTGTLLSNGMAIMVRAAADMRFYTSGHTNERMRITSNGNVGIGTASPAAKFQVTDASSSITLQNYLNGAAIFLDGVNGDFVGGDYFHILADSSSYLGVGGYAGGTTPLNVSNNGNVGIGTTSPTEKLHVAGNARITQVGTSGTTANNVPLFIDNTGVLSKTGTLPVANGGTGSATQNFVDLTTAQTVAGAKTFTSALSGTSATFKQNVLSNGSMFLGSAAGGTMQPYIASTSEATTSGFRVDVIKASNISEATGFSVGAHFLNTDFNATSGNLLNISNNQVVKFTVDYSGALTGTSATFTKTGGGNVLVYDESGRGAGFSAPGSTYGFIGKVGSITNHDFRVETGDVNLLTLGPKSGGNWLGFSTTGAATFSSSVTATTGIFTNYAGGGLNGASLDNTGQIVRTSSIVLKKDVTPIRYGLQEILNIQPVNYNWINEDRFGDNNENGFVAEDVMSIIPNTVGSDANGIFMDYTKLIPILTKAIQEQNALIKALEQRLLILENK